MRIPELLVPASSLVVLKVAVIYGADAVYIGGEVFGLRAKAKNFTLDEMREGVEFAHAHHVKVYVTANILAHNYDLEGVREYFEELRSVGPDALIISDPGIFTIAREVLPDMELHVLRPTIRIMRPICFGRNREQSVWSAQENCHLLRLRKSANIYRMIWKLRPLFTERCVYPIREDVCSAIILPDGMPIREPAHIRAVGSMRWWKRADRVNIYRFMRTKEALIFLTPRIFA